MSEALLLNRIANLAPATACGDSRPVRAPSFFGVGSMLVLRLAAKELAGRGVGAVVFSLALGGCSEARRLLSADMEVCDVSRGLEAIDLW